MLWLNKIFLILLPFVAVSVSAADSAITVGGKRFTESYILGEIMAQLLQSRGFQVHRKMGLGGTLVAFEALKEGEINLYAEYSGTLSQAILNTNANLTVEELNSRLEKQGLEVLSPFGFNNSYALAVPRFLAKKEGLTKISDLKEKKKFRIAMSHEFLKRGDGWSALRNAYGLDLKVNSLEHTLTYEALKNGLVEVIVIYATDPKVKTMDLVVLEDDFNFFPSYLAVPLVSKSLPAKAKQVINELAGKIDEKAMITLNARAEEDQLAFAEVAKEFLLESHLIKETSKEIRRFSWEALWRQTLQHLYLTAAGLLLATLVAVPLGVFLQKIEWLAQIMIGTAGLLQTVPSIALLAFMIPLFGIGTPSAIIALFLYNLLPILRNTYVALKTLDPTLAESARGIGLYNWEVLLFIRFPLGLPTILAGIKTAAVISVGTATLAAFIGAGGLGEFIVTGLALNDTSLLLQGAVPAALLAVCIEVVFSAIEHVLKRR